MHKHTAGRKKQRRDVRDSPRGCRRPSIPSTSNSMQQATAHRLAPTMLMTVARFRHYLGPICSIECSCSRVDSLARSRPRRRWCSAADLSCYAEAIADPSAGMSGRFANAIQSTMWTKCFCSLVPAVAVERLRESCWRITTALRRHAAAQTAARAEVGHLDSRAVILSLSLFLQMLLGSL